MENISVHSKGTLVLKLNVKMTERIHLNGLSRTTLGFAAPSMLHGLWALFTHSHQIQPHWGDFIVLSGSRRKEYIKSAVFLSHLQLPNSGVHQNHLGSFFKAQGLIPPTHRDGDSAMLRGAQESLKSPDNYGHQRLRTTH